jgi:hypothetical protein
MAADTRSRAAPASCGVQEGRPRVQRAGLVRLRGRRVRYVRTARAGHTRNGSGQQDERTGRRADRAGAGGARRVALSESNWEVGKARLPGRQSWLAAASGQVTHGILSAHRTSAPSHLRRKPLPILPPSRIRGCIHPVACREYSVGKRERVCRLGPSKRRARLPHASFLSASGPRANVIVPSTAPCPSTRATPLSRPIRLRSLRTVASITTTSPGCTGRRYRTRSMPMK